MELPYLFCFCEDYLIPDGERKQNQWHNCSWQRCSKRLKQMLLGSHSIQKYESTYCRACGIQQRWKRHKRSLERERLCVRCIQQYWVAVSRRNGCGCSMWWRPLYLCDLPNSSSMLLLGATVQWYLQPSCQPPGVFTTSGRSMSMVLVRERPQGFFRCKRGRSKHKHHQRRVVWDLIGDIFWQGHTADGHKDRIYAV